ncbi:biosynthetic-type acetolactate synthase large subunit [Sinanaerobacter chloroacetimidivorans]|uniref:Acetolactate synthase n=1 Tax=Sinanaerobacter chloroacetimidivorans TaxID=2818044 RepID=A0A8J8B0H8_9FIRM|nr:biosynthetic-type acetolactate synthase large subunit [Sinanaerobacter chloroacetimidivorans]MBR0597623.1 biosynthetic-type acetolactate synthase large subunit [Sinanaerobacter chloroacetimidivorans]
MITGAEAIVRSLELEGVEVIFGYPGATVCPLYDKLSKSTKIKHILVRHEQHAGHEASGYARIKKRPGVCITTSGPGATNLITALGTAYMDSIPLVAITGQVSSDLLGRDVFQEADMTGASEPFTKYSYLVKNAADLPRIIKEAFHIASTGRPGPVLIDIPVNVQNHKFDFYYPDEVELRGYKPTIKGHAGQIKRVMKAINHAERPLICVGGGIFAAGGQEVFRQFIETLNIPVVSTMMGIGAVPTAHPLYMGMLGMHGKSIANQAISDSDLLIIIGARVSDRAVLLPAAVGKSTKIVHIDIDPAEIGKNLSTFIPVVGDAKEVLNQILDAEPSRKADEWTDMLKQKKSKLVLDYDPRSYGINPKAFVNMLSKKLPDDNIYCADVGQNQIWSAANCDVREGRFLTSGGMGTMGYSIPAAIGAKTAAPDKTVVAVCGDGSFQMQMMELGTICQHNVDIKIVVMKNQKLGLVCEIQKTAYKNNITAVDLCGSPDVTAIAGAYGIPAKSISSMEEAERAIEEMLNHKGTFLLECIVDEKESSV